ncbi:MAG: aspartate--ammonia ligase, partial [Bacteroidales bacterium]|nr:aspartate--ammonia ligase [Bacteroidales bacterium]
MPLFIPKSYKPTLAPESTEQAILQIKAKFQDELSRALNLRRVTAPLFVLSGTGINDNLNGTEHPVSFAIPAIGGKKAEIVHSLAKWKRLKLAAYGIQPGEGLYADMNAIRADEDLDNIHSLYVDQWDWERAITEADRNLDFLKSIVRKIYQAVLHTE